ncbi:MAG: DUF402 domain-containing protein [Chloroflexota bacterium]|nr:MAG: DUF402 domain-containing protein [Chloroflexota bacterium]
MFLHRPGDAHSTGLFWREADGVFLFWYVNLEAPWRRSPAGFDTWDHALDLVVKPDLSSWRFKDQDEFGWMRKVGSITESEAAAILSEADRAIDRIERRMSPYCDGWENWMPHPEWAPIDDLPANWHVTD